MPLETAALLDTLRETNPVSPTAGIPPAEFEKARDAWLSERARLDDTTLASAIDRPIRIKRDHAGVPHIFAETEADLYFGLGLAMAQDRLWQMDRMRRRALGRLAELLGPDYLASDIEHLTVGIDGISARAAAAMDDATAALVTRFVAGINRWIEFSHDRLPVEFAILNYVPEPFTAVDVAAIGRGLGWGFTGHIDRIAAIEGARMLPNAESRALYLMPEAAENLIVPIAGAMRPGGLFPAGTSDATGSNNWALAPSRTTSGRTILCGDPHMTYVIPSWWYEFALHGPGGDAAGAGHPGLPGLLWGGNGHIAWALTVNSSSVRDLYLEQAHPSDPALYRDGAQWRRFEERRVEVPVRGEATRRFTVRETVRGPVVNAIIPAVAQGGDPPLSLRWVGAEARDDLHNVLGLSRAKNWTEFRAVLRDWALAVFNFVYADRDGHIGYQMAGRVPIRGRMTGGFRHPDDPADAWSGYFPFDDLPRMEDPARGYVASANQRPTVGNGRRPIYGGYSHGHRGVRIDQVLGGTARLDHAAATRLQRDVKSCRAERLCPHILRHLAGASSPLVGLLRDWDYRYTVDSAAPTAFETFMALWHQHVLSKYLPARLRDIAVPRNGLAAGLLEGAAPANEADDIAAEVRATADATVAALRSRLGPNPQDWRWERVHLAHWRHPLSVAASATVFDFGPVPVDGGPHTLCNTGGELPPHAASSGAGYRIVVDFAEPERIRAVQNLGNSGVPGNPHYNDQFRDWQEGAYHTVELRGDSVAAVNTTTINPTKSR